VSVYERIYALAEPYWQTRANDVHVPESYALARELLALLPDADEAVVLPAILLHDVGYAVVPEEDHHKGLAGAPRGWEEEITRRHEIAGAEIAGEILASVGYDPELTRRITEIVDGHDSRTDSLGLEDEIVKDADKLWRFTPSGVHICHSWMNQTPEQFMDFVESRLESWLYTEEGKALARRELARARTDDAAARA
jgi:HD superfamily phosphodiesterase